MLLPAVDLHPELDLQPRGWTYRATAVRQDEPRPLQAHGLRMGLEREHVRAGLLVQLPARHGGIRPGQRIRATQPSIRAVSCQARSTGPVQTSDLDTDQGPRANHHRRAERMKTKHGRTITRRAAGLAMACVLALPATAAAAIVPGHRVAGVKLGDSATRVTAVLGKPASVQKYKG